MTSHPDFEGVLVPEGRCRRGVFDWFALGLRTDPRETRSPATDVQLRHQSQCCRHHQHARAAASSTL